MSPEPTTTPKANTPPYATPSLSNQYVSKLISFAYKNWKSVRTAETLDAAAGTSRYMLEVEELGPTFRVRCLLVLATLEENHVAARNLALEADKALTDFVKVRAAAPRPYPVPTNRLRDLITSVLNLTPSSTWDGGSGEAEGDEEEVDCQQQMEKIRDAVVGLEVMSGEVVYSDDQGKECVLKLE